MTLKEAYGAAFKAALGIIGFYIAAGVVILLGMWTFFNGDVIVGGALAVLGMILAWLAAFAVIIKTSADEATRRSARRIDASAIGVANRIGGRNESPAALGESGGGKMSWQEAFGVSIKATLWIIVMNIGFSFLTGVCYGLAFVGVALWATVGIVGALLIAIGVAGALVFAVYWILCPFAIIMGYSITIAEKRSERRIAAAARFMTDRLDARAASPPDARAASLPTRKRSAASSAEKPP